MKSKKRTLRTQRTSNPTFFHPATWHSTLALSPSRSSDKKGLLKKASGLRAYAANRWLIFLAANQDRGWVVCFV